MLPFRMKAIVSPGTVVWMAGMRRVCPTERVGEHAPVFPDGLASVGVGDGEALGEGVRTELGAHAGSPRRSAPSPSSATPLVREFNLT
jgi:hypothetical protein